MQRHLVSVCNFLSSSLTQIILHRILFKRRIQKSVMCFLKVGSFGCFSLVYLDYLVLILLFLALGYKS